MIRKQLMKKIAKWSKIQDQFLSLKDQESALRDEIAFALDKLQAEGTKSFDIDQDTILKLKQTYVLNVDEKELSKLTALVPKVVLEKVFKQKHSVSRTEYKKLSLAHKELIDRCITEKPSKPVLEVAERPE